MNSWKSNSVCALIATGLLFVACSGSEPGEQGESGGSGGGMSTGGRTSGTGSASGAVLDLDGLAANCQGVTATEGESCAEADLVCRDKSGASCVCGGIVNTQATMPSRPGSTNKPPRDLFWECFVIGGTKPDGMGGLGGEGPTATGGDSSGGAGAGGAGAGGSPTGGGGTGGSNSGGTGGTDSGGSHTGGSGGTDLGGAAGASN